MELGNFTPPERAQGDQINAKDAVDRPLIVQVREHRTGVITKFKPEGGEAVVVDVADTAGDSVWINAAWFNGAVVDGLAPYVGQTVPIKLIWTPSASGGYPFIGVAALEGAELDGAQRWAAANPSRFETERAQRQQQQDAAPQGQSSQAPPATVAQQQPQPAQPAPAQGNADPNDPAVQALLTQINAGQAPPAS